MNIENQDMDQSLNKDPFREDLLRSYLGKYSDRFKSMSDKSGTLRTDPHPIVVAQLWRGPIQMQVSLYEYVEVEEDDPYYGAFDYYQIDIITVALADPIGAGKIETAVARTFLTGTQLIRWTL